MLAVLRAGCKFEFVHWEALCFRKAKLAPAKIPLFGLGFERLNGSR